MRLMDKVALITGASRGIGCGIAVGFAREGADVIVHYRTRKDEAEKVVQEIRTMGRQAQALQLDLENVQEIEQFIEKAWSIFNRIDILVNNAGIAYFESFLSLSFEQWRKVLSINLDSVMLCCQHVAKKDDSV